MGEETCLIKTNTVQKAPVAAALGDYKDAADAAAHMCRSVSRVLPRPDAAKVYEEKYALYLKTIECLNALWPDMQRFMEEHHA